MSNYNFEINNKVYSVAGSKDGYKTFFEAVQVTDWNRVGFIGCYFPATKNCGFLVKDQNDVEYKFSAQSTGPKNAAQLCLTAFLSMIPNYSEVY